MHGDDVHAALIDDLVRRRGVVMLIGGSDTGKTSFAGRLLRARSRNPRMAKRGILTPSNRWA